MRSRTSRPGSEQLIIDPQMNVCLNMEISDVADGCSYLDLDTFSTKVPESLPRSTTMRLFDSCIRIRELN